MFYLVSSQVPSSTHIDNDQAGPVTLGTRFRSNVNGTISAIRFYKHAANTGTHVEVDVVFSQ